MFAQVLKCVCVVCVCSCILYSKFWTESVRPSRLGSVQTWSKAWALVSVNKREDFSPAGSLLQGLLHSLSTLCYSWSQTLKIITDGELCAYDDQGVSYIWAEPVCPNCWADLVCDYTHTHQWALTTHILTPVHTNLEAQIAQSPTSVQKYFKKTFSHYWVTFYRKRLICAPVVYVCVLLFHLGRENCRQPNRKQSTASTNQVQRGIFSQPTVLWHL